MKGRPRPPRRASARRESIDARLAALDLLPAEPEAAAAQLRAALGERNHRVVAKAAQRCADGLRYELAGALVGAFRRMLGDQAAKLDPGCVAKKAIARALVALDCDDVEFFRDGLRYRQLEPVWGGTQDTAVDVRCQCAMGLVASGYSRALVEVVELMSDTDPAARLGAVRAIGCGHPLEAELLLRTKVLTGDAEPAVLGECFIALFAVAPEESIAFVARYLDVRDEAVQELAALALGESRLPAALEPLVAAWQGVLVGPSLRRALLRGAAAHRSEPAHAWLLELVRDARPATAADIVEVLALYKHDAKLAGRLEDALRARGERALLERFAQVWRAGKRSSDSGG